MADHEKELEFTAKKLNFNQNPPKAPIQKPLSERWQGYVLAVTGGAFGGTVGLIASPIVLLTTTHVQRNQRKKASPESL